MSARQTVLNQRSMSACLFKEQVLKGYLLKDKNASFKRHDRFNII